MDVPVAAFDLVPRPFEPRVVSTGELLCQSALCFVVQTLKNGLKVVKVLRMQKDPELARREGTEFELLKSRHHVRNDQFSNDFRGESFHGNHFQQANVASY